MKLVNRGYSKSVDFKIFVMKRFLLSILFFVGVVMVTFSQSTGDFQSRQTGNWNDSNTWEEWDGSTWVDTGNVPAGTESVISVLSGMDVTIPAGYTVTISSGSILDNFGQITIGSSRSGSGQLNIDGILRNNEGSAFSGDSNTRLAIRDGGEYNHNFISTSNDIVQASWASGSNLMVTGYDNVTVAPGNLNQSFYNVIWDTPLLDGNADGILDFGGQLNSIANTFTIENSGAILVFADGVSANISIGNNLVLNNGSLVDLNFGANGSTTVSGNVELNGTSKLAMGYEADYTLNIENSLIINGGTFVIDEEDFGIFGTTGSTTLNLNGDLTLASGTSMVENGTGNATINFNGGVNQQFTKLGSTSGEINYSISNSSNLILAKNFLDGSGNFEIGAGSTLITASTDGINTGTSSGAIRVSGTRTYNTGATIEYNGNSTQSLGSGFPSSGVNLTINNTGGGVNMNSDVTISDNRTLTLTEGTLNIGDGNLLTLNGDVSTTNGGLSGGSLSDLTIGGTGAFGTLGFVGTQELNNFTINRTSSGTVTLGGDLLINGTFEQTAGNLILNGNTFTLSGPYSRTAGSLVSDAAASLIINGSGALPSPASFSGDINTLTLNRASSIFDVGGSGFTASNINLFSGELTGSSISIADGGNVERQSSGVLTNELTAVGTYNLLYNNDVTFNSGAELSTDPTAIANLEKANTGDLNIQNGFTVNGTLTFSNGTFNAGTNTISLNGDLVTNAGSTLADATITFDGATNLSGSNTPTFGDITVNGTFNPATNLNVNGDITNNGTLNSSAGTLTINATSQLGGTNPITVNNLTIGGSGAVTANSSQALTINGDIDNSGSFNANGGTVIFGGTTSISGTVPTFANIQVDGTFNAPATLNISGGLTNNGTFNDNDGIINMNGSGTREISGSSAFNIYTLNVSGGTVNNNNTGGVFIEDGITLGASTTLDLDGGGTGEMTLLSTSTKDAFIGEIPSGSAVSGTVTVQRALYATDAGDNAYHIVGFPMSNVAVSDIQNELPVTGVFFGSSTGTGYDNNPSMYAYDEDAGAGLTLNERYVAFPSSSNTETFNVGEGYYLYTYPGVIPVTMDGTGIINTGSFTRSLSFTGTDPDAGWHLVANPYPAPTDWSQWGKTAIAGNTAQIYNSNTGAYIAYDGSSEQLIPQGQGFFVQATDGTGELTATESTKVTGTTPTYYRETDIPQRFEIVLTTPDYDDVAIVHFAEGATDAYEAAFDANRLLNTYETISTLSSDGKPLKVNRMASTSSESPCSRSINISFEQLKNEVTYSITFNDLGNVPSQSFQLVDHYLDKNISVDNNTKYNFTVNSDGESKSSDRFELLISSNSPSQISTSSSDVCPNQNAELILENTDSYVTYLLYKDSELLTSVEGTGATLDLDVSKEVLVDEINDFVLKGFVAGCDTVSVGSAQIKIAEALSLDNKVTGSSICKVETQAPFSIVTQLDANYYLVQNEDTIQSIQGTGSQYDGFIASENLNDGSNEFIIVAEKDGCQSGTLEQILKINVENLTIDRTVAFEVDDSCINSEASINFTGQAEVEYKFYKNNELVNSLVGDGSDQSITIPAEFITVGENEYTVMAFLGNCSEYEFAEKISLNVEESIQPDLSILAENACGLQNVNVKIENAQKAKTYNLLSNGEVAFSATANEDGELFITLDSSKLNMGLNQFNILIEGEYCEAMEANQTVEFELYEDAVIGEIENQSICLNESTTIDLSANVEMSSYSLYVGDELISESAANIIELAPKETTTYKLTGVPENGCSVNSVNFTIEVNDLAVPGILVAGNVLESSIEADTYQWYLDGSILEDETGKILVANAPGDYTVEVSKGNCSNLSDAFTFNEEVLNANKILENALKLYPNPVSDKMFIELNNINSIDITIFTINGKFIDKFKLNKGQSEIEMSKFTKGTYLIQIESDKGTVTKRIIKQ